MSIRYELFVCVTSHIVYVHFSGLRMNDVCVLTEPGCTTITIILSAMQSIHTW